MDKEIEVRSGDARGSEISWFAPICDGDDRYLGERSEHYRSSWKNASEILLTADRLGYNNILCPSSFQVGLDTLTFASAVAPMTQHISLLPAIRCGEIHPPMLARAIATLDHILQGRLTLNIISSNLPGVQLSSIERYARSAEVIQILQQAWTQDHISYHGEFYSFDLDSRPAIPYQQNGGPLLYFGGYSEPGLELCARFCDVYLMWPDTEEGLEKSIADMKKRANCHQRTLDFGLRIHVIVRESETEARQAARGLVSKLNDQFGSEIRDRALDSRSKGVALQGNLRNRSDSEGFAEDLLWTGIGRARSGCGAALVGSPEQIIGKLEKYMDLGIRAFIFSGYPHREECERFARLVLPGLNQVCLAKIQNRIPEDIPLTPLGNGKRY